MNKVLNFMMSFICTRGYGLLLWGLMCQITFFPNVNQLCIHMTPHLTGERLPPWDETS